MWGNAGNVAGRRSGVSHNINTHLGRQVKRSSPIVSQSSRPSIHQSTYLGMCVLDNDIRCISAHCGQSAEDHATSLRNDGLAATGQGSRLNSFFHWPHLAAGRWCLHKRDLESGPKYVARSADNDFRTATTSALTIPFSQLMT